MHFVGICNTLTICGSLYFDNNILICFDVCPNLILDNKTRNNKCDSYFNKSCSKKYTFIKYLTYYLIQNLCNLDQRKRSFSKVKKWIKDKLSFLDEVGGAEAITQIRHIKGWLKTFWSFFSRVNMALSCKHRSTSKEGL